MFYSLQGEAALLSELFASPEVDQQQLQVSTLEKLQSAALVAVCLGQLCHAIDVAQLSYLQVSAALLFGLGIWDLGLGAWDCMYASVPVFSVIVADN